MTITIKEEVDSDSSAEPDAASPDEGAAAEMEESFLGSKPAERSEGVPESAESPERLASYKEKLGTIECNKKSLETRIKTLRGEKAGLEAQLRETEKLNKLSQLRVDADSGSVKAKFLLDQLLCYGKESYRWSEATLQICSDWLKKHPKDYDQCSSSFLSLPTRTELGLSAADDSDSNSGSDETETPQFGKKQKMNK